MQACPTAHQHEQRSIGLGFARPVSPAYWSLSRRSPEPSATSFRRRRPRRTHPPSTSVAVPLARPVVRSPTARRSLTTKFRVSPNLIQRSSVPYAEPQLMARTTGSSSSSIVAGAPRSTRDNFSIRRSRSTARKRKPNAGWPPPRRLLTCRGTRSTLGTPMPRRGCPSTAPSTGCARSTATNPGTTSCVPRPASTGALPCTPILRTIQGCSADSTLLDRACPQR